MESSIPSLEKISLRDFEPLVGESFAVSVDEESQAFTTFVLESAKQTGSLPEPFRQPFALTFSGTPDHPLDQQTLWLSHPSLPAMPTFIVPMAGDADKRLYHAAFN